MLNIPIGTRGEHKLLVTAEVAVDFMGKEGARVFSTPHLIGYLEITARNSVMSLLEPGYDSVGTVVSVRHLAATPIGMAVTFRSEVLSVEDRKVNFRVEAWDEVEKIAEGTHERFVIHVERFAQRLQSKRKPVDN